MSVLLIMRKPRIIRDGALYHVVARANRREYILSPDEIKSMFLDVVAGAKRKYRFHIVNFCVMNNHFHFMIAPLKGENISRIMQWILSVFAVRYNKRFGLCGHVWYDRFKSKIVDGILNFLHAFRYIAENPVRAGIVTRAWEYEFNGVTFLRNKDFHIMERPDPLLLLWEPSFCTPPLLSEI